MTTIQTYPKLTVELQPATDAIVVVLTASRDVEGERVPITDAQKDAAADAAKAVLQCVGAEVAASSTSFLIPGQTFASGQTASLTLDAAIVAAETEEA